MMTFGQCCDKGTLKVINTGFKGRFETKAIVECTHCGSEYIFNQSLILVGAEHVREANRTVANRRHLVVLS